MLALSIPGDDDPLLVSADPLVLAERAFAVARAPWTAPALGQDTPQGRRYHPAEVSELVVHLGAAMRALGSALDQDGNAKDGVNHWNTARELRAALALLQTAANDGAPIVVEV